MNKVNVRCWKIFNYRQGSDKPDELFITYPENDAGYDLVSCSNCGSIYAASMPKQLYIMSLSDQLLGMHCVTCGADLGSAYIMYPEKYLGSDGIIYEYKRNEEVPEDSESIVRDFYDLYSSAKKNQKSAK